MGLSTDLPGAAAAAGARRQEAGGLARCEEIGGVWHRDNAFGHIIDCNKEFKLDNVVGGGGVAVQMVSIMV